MVKLAGEARVGTIADMINQTLKERVAPSVWNISTIVKC